MADWSEIDPFSSKNQKGLIILPTGKMLKNCHNYTLVFQHFSLETMKKKLSK